MPDDYLSDVEQAIIEYETPLMISFGAGLLCLSSVVLATGTTATSTFIAVFAGSAAASWIAYRLSFRAAEEYSDLLRTAVDLYRNDLLKKWWPELLAISDDRRRLEALREFVLTGKKPLVRDIIPAQADNGSSLLVISSRHKTEYLAEPPRPAKPRVPRFGIPLSVYVALVVAIVGWVGQHRLDEKTSVVAVTRAIPTLGSIVGAVEIRNIRHGSVGRDALEVPPGADLNKLVANALALRPLQRGSVLRRSDVSTVVVARPGTVIVSISVPRSEVDLLMLRVGDRVFITGSSSGSPGCNVRASTTDVTTTNVSPPATPSTEAPDGFAEGDVLSVRFNVSGDQTSIAVAVAADDLARLCTDSLDQLRIVRPAN
jgi:hypothetical protein